MKYATYYISTSLVTWT